MAATIEARRLTEAHRLAQSRLGARTITALADVWALLDPLDLAGSFPQWLRPAWSIVNEQRSASIALASNYLPAYKVMEAGPEAGVRLADPDPLDLDQFTTSMLVTGPIEAKKALARGLTIGEAMRLAQATSSAAGMRHTLDGGRTTISRTIDNDNDAYGFARVTSGKCCSFCAMLASRGPVYSSNTGRFRSHDHCGCSLEPVYRPDSDWPASSRKWQRMWDEAKKADGDTTQEFRRLVEAA